MPASHDPELVTVSAEVTSRGIAIPAPKDPVERARWEAGVAARKSAGLGTQVGDYAPRLVVGEFQCDGCTETFSDEQPVEVDGPGGWTMCAGCAAKHAEGPDPMAGVEFPFADNH